MLSLGKNEGFKFQHFRAKYVCALSLLNVLEFGIQRACFGFRLFAQFRVRWLTHNFECEGGNQMGLGSKVEGPTICLPFIRLTRTV